MAALTQEQLEEIQEDVHFFLDEFGSTGAARRKLCEQTSEIRRLGSAVRRLQGRPHSGNSENQEEDNNHNKEKLSEEEEDHEVDEVDQIQADVEFFLEVFGSTRVVRDQLESQRKEIVGLQRTVRWMEERERKRKRSGTSQGRDMVSIAGENGENKVEDGDTGTGPTALGALVEETYSELMELFPPVIAAMTGKRGLEGLKELSSPGKRRRADTTSYGLRIHATAGDSFDLSPSVVDSSWKEHVRENSEKCRVQGCDQARGKGEYCGDHEIDRIVAKHRTCKIKGCAQRVNFRGYCREHGAEGHLSNLNQPVSCGTYRAHKICKVASCRRWAMRNGNHPLYCKDHQGRLGIEGVEADNASSSNTASVKSTEKRRGHTTCKVHGCMKWVTQDGTKYCPIHQGEPSRDAPTAGNERGPTENFNTHRIHRESEARFEKTTGSKGLRRLLKKKRTNCKHPGCTKKAKLKGLCKAHGSWSECKVVGCDKHAYLQGYCKVHSRALASTFRDYSFVDAYE